jgi:hypothetical protein
MMPMTRAMLLHCLPWLGLLAVLVGLAWLAARLAGGRFELSRLRRLHGDQDGAVQSLAFVLTVPFFIMVLMMIVQVSQLMIGLVVVHYAALAAARSAIVWIPANLGEGLEQENQISSYEIDPNAPDQVAPELDPTAADYGPGQGGLTYVVDVGTPANPASPKCAKILSAAVLGCMPITPSRNLNLDLPTDGQAMAQTLQAAYGSMVSSSASNGAINGRIANKLAYAMAATTVEVRFYHPNFEPPLVCYDPPVGVSPPSTLLEFQPNELGWQDQVTVKVTHLYALLPGPGRLLARIIPHPDGSPTDGSASLPVQQLGGVYVYPLTAEATLGNEGEKSVLPYENTIE